MKIHDLIRCSVYGEIHLISITCLRMRKLRCQVHSFQMTNQDVRSSASTSPFAPMGKQPLQRNAGQGWPAGAGSGAAAAQGSSRCDHCAGPGAGEEDSGAVFSLSSSLRSISHQLCLSSPSAPPCQHLQPVRHIPAKFVLHVGSSAATAAIGRALGE